MKGWFSKIVIIFMFGYSVYFTERVLNIFEHTRSEPSMLIGTMLGMIVVQFINLASIKKMKVKVDNGNMVRDNIADAGSGNWTGFDEKSDSDV